MFLPELEKAIKLGYKRSDFWKENSMENRLLYSIFHNKCFRLKDRKERHKCFKYLSKFLRHSLPYVRAQAVSDSVRILYIEEILKEPELLEKSRDLDELVRFAFYANFSRYSSELNKTALKKYITYIVRGLKDNNSEVRRVAARALEDIFKNKQFSDFKISKEGKRFKKELEKLLTTEKERKVLYPVACLIYCFDNQQGLKLIENGLKNEDFKIRGTTLQSLEGFKIIDKNLYPLILETNDRQLVPASRSSMEDLLIEYKKVFG